MSSLEPGEQELLAGASERRITPPVGLPLLGPLQASTGLHDDPFARTLVLSDGKKEVALVCLDLIGFDHSFADEIRTSVKRETGVATTLLNCSHTHSAPFTIPWSVQGWEDFQREAVQWRGELAAAIVGVVREAVESLQPVVLRAGRAPVQVGFNRRLLTNEGMVMRPNPEGAVVPWVDVLRVDSDDGNPIAVLFSHGAHPVIVHAASTLISADYPGFAVATVREYFGANVVPMFAQGCGGNINGEPLRGGFEAAERAGVALGEATIKSAEASEPIAPAPLRCVTRSIDLPLQPLPSEEECEKVLRLTESRLSELEEILSANDLQVWSQRDCALRLRELLEKIRRGKEEPLRFDLNLVSLGEEWSLLAMNHEVFAEYQLWTGAASPFRRTMVWAYTNGCETYVPTDAAFEHGGYEAALAPASAAALAYRYRLALKPGIEAQIKEAIKGLWEGA